MNQFFNKPEKVVTQAIDGILSLCGNQKLVRGDGFPATKFVVRGDWDKSKVAIISGGGAGHEPSHIGFIGKGMLTAAVSGEVFASPSVEAVLSCILKVAGEQGCLLIVKNYTGDRLNFGLAAERAKKMGKKVEMVIVSDDVALPNATQPRGLAGTLFVHKTAGYYAEQGESLSYIKQKAQEVAQNIYSLGIAIETCTLPGAQKIERAEAPELGLGIHGEPGLEKVNFNSGKEAVAVVLSRLFAETDANAKYALLVNNLGAVTPLEMYIIVNEILNSTYKQQIELVVGPAALMTSLNMYGFSLSLLKLDAELKKILTEPVEPRAWMPAIVPAQPILSDISDLQLKKKFTPSKNPRVQDFIQTICAAMINNEQHLNELDKKVGDGDTGSTFASGAKAIQKMIDNNELPLNNFPELLVAIGEAVASHMGGSSGVLTSIMLINAGHQLSKGDDFADSLLSGLHKMMEYGGAKQGGRTMVDALLPAIKLLKENNLEAAATAAREGAISTKDMKRSSYLRAESLLGTTDPGAEAIAIIFESIQSKVYSLA